VHPLLFARREQIELWLTSRGLRWRTDRTNRTRRYLRNRVRLDLLPTLAREYNPRIVERLCSLARCLRRDSERLALEAADLLATCESAPGHYLIPPQLLSTAHPAVLSRVLLSALRAVAKEPADFGNRHIEALLAPGHGARSWNLPGGVTAARDGAGLRIASPAGRSRVIALPRSTLAIPGGVALTGGASLTAELSDCPPGFDPRRFGANPLRVAVDLDRVRPPLTVRGRLPGERFQPLGLAVPKRLQDFFVDAGIPAGERARIPLVCDRDSIVWVAGVRPAEFCRVTAGTRRLLVLTLQMSGGSGLRP
jgi:tRNA(Ile)-lysidine synthase